jgi:hypothetical protein
VGTLLSVPIPRKSPRSPGGWKFYAAALEAGGTDNGPPGDRAEAWALPAPTFEYYAAFVLDPDGNNIEAVFRG